MARAKCYCNKCKKVTEIAGSSQQNGTFCSVCGHKHTGAIKSHDNDIDFIKTQQIEDDMDLLK